MVQEDYYVNKKNKVREEIKGYRAKIADIDQALEFETDPKKHAQLKRDRQESESAIEIAQAKFRVIDKEREDQIKAEQAAEYDALKEQIGKLSPELVKLGNGFYKLLAEVLVPNLDKFEKLFHERALLEREINILARNSGGDLQPMPKSPTSVIGLSIPGNDMRAPSITKHLVEAIQLHHQIYQSAIKRGRKPKFKLSKELLAEVGYFNVTQDGEIYKRSPEQRVLDDIKHEANRDWSLVNKVEVN